MGWKERFTFRDKRYVEHTVGGAEFRFYPNRMALLTEARDLSEPVAKAITILFADESRDSGTSVKRNREGDFYMEDIQTQPISEELAKYRQAERDRAIEAIFGTLADKRSVLLLGRLFMDSLRDEFPYKMDRGAAEIEEFLYGHEGPASDYQGLDMPVLIELFRGWMKANAKVFGEAGEKMVGLVRQRLEQAQLGFGSEETPETDPTSGSSSRKPSLPQLVPDSPPST